MKGRPFELGVRAGRVLTMAGGEAREERDLFLGVSGGQLLELSRFRPSQRKASRKFLDASASAVIPGLINAHTHLPMVLFRGVADDLSFHDWLFGRILPLEAKLISPAFVRDGLELAALECIRFGVTTVNEMYFFAEEEARVLDRAGLRAVISQCLASFPLPEDPFVGQDKLAIAERLRKRYARHPRIRIGLGPHAPYSCDDALLSEVAKFAAGSGAPVHIHLSETAREVEESLMRHGVSPVERLRRLGILGKGTTCAHCVHLSEDDRAVFASSGAAAVYNPDSNAKLGSGVAPVGDFLRRGIPLALGTDGAASNNDLSLFGAMDIGAKLQQLAAGGAASGYRAEDALRAATWGGARALGLGELTGSLEPGKRADFVVLSLDQPHLQPMHGLVSQLVYSASGLEVSATVCDGRILYSGGKFLSLDARKIYAKVERWRKKLGPAG